MTKAMKTTALFLALAIGQTAVIPAVYAEDDAAGSVSKVQMQKERERERLKRERERERLQRERARQTSVKSSTTPVVSAPVVSTPVVTAPVVTAPVVTTPVVTTKPVTTTPTTSTSTAPTTSTSTSTTPAIDGAALYTQKCAGCHGTSKMGKTASAISSAISNNTGGMSFLSSLSSAQITAISMAK